MEKDFEYIFSLKKYIFIVVDIFLLSLIIGLLVSVKNPGLSENYIETLGKTLGWIKTLNPLIIMLVIFLNNALKSLLALVLGVGFGIVPILFVAGNGIILSILADSVSRQHGTLFVVAAILPHGIIEVPMILISAGMGLRLGHVMYLSLKGMRDDIKQEFNQSFRFYMKWVVPLLFLAAMVETFVTPIIAGITI